MNMYVPKMKYCYKIVDVRGLLIYVHYYCPDNTWEPEAVVISAPLELNEMTEFKRDRMISSLIRANAPTWKWQDQAIDNTNKVKKYINKTGQRYYDSHKFAKASESMMAKRVNDVKYQNINIVDPEGESIEEDEI